MNVLSSQITLLVKSLELKVLSGRRQELAKQALVAELDVISRKRHDLAREALAAEKEITYAIENLNNDLDGYRTLKGG